MFEQEIEAKDQQIKVSESNLEKMGLELSSTEAEKSNKVKKLE